MVLQPRGADRRSAARASWPSEAKLHSAAKAEALGPRGDRVLGGVWTESWLGGYKYVRLK